MFYNEFSTDLTARYIPPTRYRMMIVSWLTLQFTILFYPVRALVYGSYIYTNKCRTRVLVLVTIIGHVLEVLSNESWVRNIGPMASPTWTFDLIFASKHAANFAQRNACLFINFTGINPIQPNLTAFGNPVAVSTFIFDFRLECKNVTKLRTEYQAGLNWKVPFDTSRRTHKILRGGAREAKNQEEQPTLMREAHCRKRYQIYRHKQTMGL